MYRIIFILLFLNMAYTCFAQGWSTPVNVSNMGTHCNSPKMVVDHNGTIHAVWSSWVTQEYRKIMYSKSETHGDTWSTPIAIADDSLQWFAQPDIACDLQNHLYVSYEGDAMDPSSTRIYIVIFDGTQWGIPFAISENMYGSNNSIVLVDHSNRMYCFWHAWYNNEVKLVYKYYENNSWSQPIIPYTQDGEFFWIKKVVADSSNNLHCVGTHHYNNESRYKDRVIYCYFYRNTNQWATIENISDTTNRSWWGNSIDIDKNSIPHFAWRQYISPGPSLENATLYRYPTEMGWLQVDSVEVNHDSHAHQLVVDIGNKSNIVVVEWTIYNELTRLIHYKKVEANWVGEVIDSIWGAVYAPNLIEISNYDIALLYEVSSAYIGDTILDIFFTKYDIFTNISELNTRIIELEVFPNPLTRQAEIKYNNHSECRVVLDILDLNGKLIERLIDQTQSPGRYCHTWQCTSLNRKEVKAGVYIVRLQAGRYVYSRKVVKL